MDKKELSQMKKQNKKQSHL